MGAAALASSLAVGVVVASGALAPVPPASAAAATIRLAGADRIDTAIAVSQAGFPHFGAAGVVLARSDLFPDALAGTPLARGVNGPLLLTNPDSLDPRVQVELSRVLPPGGNVYLLGTEDALSLTVENQVTAAGYHPVRLGGVDRFETARIIADYIAAHFGVARIFEATGLNFPDALSGGPPAGLFLGVILLTNDTTMNPQTAAFISGHMGLSRFALGDQAVAADSSLPPPPGGTVALAGPDRFGTSAAVANFFFGVSGPGGPHALGAATGLNFPDALAGGADMAMRMGPMLLVLPSTPLPPDIDTYVHTRTSPPTNSVVGYGGSDVVGSDVLNAMATAIS